MIPLVTFMVQLQSLVLGLGGGMQEKDTVSQLKAF